MADLDEATEALHIASQRQRRGPGAHRVLTITVHLRHEREEGDISGGGGGLGGLFDDADSARSPGSVTSGSISFFELASSDSSLRPNAGLDALESLATHLHDNPHLMASASDGQTVPDDSADPNPPTTGSAMDSPPSTADGLVLRRRHHHHPGHLYRQSSLTQLLRPFLGGHGRALFVSTLDPNPSALPETKRSLSFASIIVRAIRNVPRRRFRVPLPSPQLIVQGLNAEVTRLRDELRRQREHDGVFLSPEAYEGIQRKLSAHHVEMSDVGSQLHLSQTRCDTLQAERDSLQTQLNELYANKSDTLAVLLRTESELMEAEKRSKEAGVLLRIYQDMQPKLYARATDLQNTLRRVVGYAERLESKVQQLREGARLRRERARHLEASLSQSLGRLRTSTKTHLATQTTALDQIAWTLHSEQGRLERSVDDTRSTLNALVEGVDAALAQLTQDQRSHAGAQLSQYEALASQSEREKELWRQKIAQLVHRVNSSVVRLQEGAREAERGRRKWSDRLQSAAEAQGRLAESVMQDQAAAISQIGDVLTTARSQSQLASAKRARMIGEYIEREKAHIARVSESVSTAIEGILQKALDSQYQRALTLLQSDKAGINTSDSMLYNVVQDVAGRLVNLKNHTNSWGRQIIQQNIVNKDQIEAHSQYGKVGSERAHTDSSEIFKGTLAWAQDIHTTLAESQNSFQNLVNVGRGGFGQVVAAQEARVRGIREYLGAQNQHMQHNMIAYHSQVSNVTRNVLEDVGNLHSQEQSYGVDHEADAKRLENISLTLTGLQNLGMIGQQDIAKTSDLGINETVIKTSMDYLDVIDKEIKKFETVTTENENREFESEESLGAPQVARDSLSLNESVRRGLIGGTQNLDRHLAKEGAETPEEHRYQQYVASLAQNKRARIVESPSSTTG